MKKITFLISIITLPLLAQPNSVQVFKDNKGFKLQVDNTDFFVKGMNWDYFPLGTNYEYSLWNQPEHFIKKALHQDMQLLQKMGVNAIRQYTGIPAKWISYIYEEYHIFTMLNHPFGRYGISIDNQWIAKTDYSNPKVQKVLLQEIEDLAKKYKNTKGLLLFLIGNENNYGLSWEGAATENIPEEQKNNQQINALYQLFNAAATRIKAVDKNHPVALCNGDLQYIDKIKKYCSAIDILGTNMYRGISFGTAFLQVKENLNKPILFTEFGADAYNNKTQKEDATTQAKYVLHNWEEIYCNAYNLGNANNSLGGFTFQFSDGWWKYLQTQNLDLHDTHASWENGGYTEDYEKGKNNMNEEWFGVFKKQNNTTDGRIQLQPRTAVFILEEIHKINPLSTSINTEKIANLFSSLEIKYHLIN